MQYPERHELLLPDGFLVIIDTRPRKGPFVRARALVITYLIPLVLLGIGLGYGFASGQWGYGLTLLLYAVGVQGSAAMQYHNGFNDACHRTGRRLQERADEVRTQVPPDCTAVTAAVDALVTCIRADIDPLREPTSFHRSQMDLWTGPIVRTHGFPIDPPSSGYLTHARLTDLRPGDRVLKGHALGSTVHTPPEPIGTAMLLRLRDDDTQQVSECILGADSVLIVGRTE